MRSGSGVGTTSALRVRGTGTPQKKPCARSKRCGGKELSAIVAEDKRASGFTPEVAAGER